MPDLDFKRTLFSYLHISKLNRRTRTAITDQRLRVGEYYDYLRDLFEFTYNNKLEVDSALKEKLTENGDDDISYTKLDELIQEKYGFNPNFSSGSSGDLLKQVIDHYKGE